jgi:hypothetical protein
MNTTLRRLVEFSRTPISFRRFFRSSKEILTAFATTAKEYLLLASAERAANPDKYGFNKLEQA